MVARNILPTKQIYKSKRQGIALRTSKAYLDKFLSSKNITAARHDEICASAVKDGAHDWPGAFAHATNDDPINVHIFLKKLFDTDSNAITTRSGAYGTWNGKRVTEENEPPRDGCLYDALAIFNAADGNLETGRFGAWEQDIKPSLLRMGDLVESIKNHAQKNPKGYYARVLTYLSAAMARSADVDIEGEFANAYAELQRAKRDCNMSYQIQRDLRNRETDLECNWDELARRVEQEFGRESAEFLLMALWRDAPYRDDLHALRINPSDETGNFIRMSADFCEIVINEHKTAHTWGVKRNALGPVARELALRYVETRGLKNEDFLLGDRPHSAWVSNFLSTIGVKTERQEGAINLLRHTWATTYYDEVAARYDRGAINAKERKAVYEQLCRLMCHSPAAAKKYLNRVKRGDPSPIARDWLDAFVRSRRDDA